MKKVTMMTGAVLTIALMMTACGNKTGKAGDADSLQTDSVTADSAQDGVNKHTEAYLRERVDSFYFNYKNPQYQKDGMRIYNAKFINRDSAYCSKSYKELMNKAAEIAAENEEPLLDYDHWTNSQDDNNFTCKVGIIEKMTDSTAIVNVKAKNFGKPYTVILSMRFERGDWYVDDFISEDGTGEKQYFKEYIERNTFYQRFSLNDLLYLTEHYAESAKAEKSGLSLIYHDSQSGEEMDCDEYVYGRDISKSTKKELGYDLITNTPHAFYFSMSLDTSTNGRLYFYNTLDANDFFERVGKTKPFTFESKHIAVKKESNGKSFLIQEVRKDKSTDTMFAIHRPVSEGEYFLIEVEIYV